MISDGRYTLVYKDGQYRTVQVRKQKEGKWAAGATILKLKVGKDWEGCGFLNPDGKVNFWKKFRTANPPERLQRIQTAINRILKDPEGAGMSYAMQENQCYLCGKKLTVPASIHRGKGPECARKAVKREDNKQAYQWRAGVNPQAPVPKYEVPREELEFKKKSLQPQTELFRHPDEEEMDRMVREGEQEQEARAFMSDPDMYNPTDKFWQELCGICRVPRFRCSC